MYQGNHPQFGETGPAAISKGGSPTFKTWDQQYQEGKGLRWFPNEELVRFLGRRWPERKAEGDVLDIGAGTANNAWALLDWGFKVMMIEPSLYASGIGRRYLAERGIDKQGRWGSLQATGGIFDAPSLWPMGAEFDGAIDMMTSQHFSLAEHQVAYKEVRRLLKPGGWFFLFHLGDLTKNYERIFPTTPPAQLLSPEQIGSLIYEAGFKAKSFNGILRYYDNESMAHYWAIEMEAV